MTAPTTAHPGPHSSQPGQDRAAFLPAPSGHRPERGGQSALSSLKLPPAFGLGGFSQPLFGGVPTDVPIISDQDGDDRLFAARHPSAAQQHQPSKPARERIAGQVLRCKLRHSPRAALDTLRRAG